MTQTSEARSRIMRAIRSRDTKPELLVRAGPSFGFQVQGVP